ncbi:hypothetical protein UFOVP354_4 [uncultured Caudovirales phage]|uniref:Uncharacterized protein n=1 Tax=uncultured Caudovirales phage TaxID=2100421 RepID=A0A6J5M3Z4_9CAUD|nr:hypothetical protein UFOVP354_4 [uncultured Caudovirales phage]
MIKLNLTILRERNNMTIHTEKPVQIENVTFSADGGLKITISKADAKTKSIRKFSYTLSDLLDAAILDMILSQECSATGSENRDKTRKAAQKTLAAYLKMHAANIEMRDEY